MLSLVFNEIICFELKTTIRIFDKVNTRIPQFNFLLVWEFLSLIVAYRVWVVLFKALSN